ncbi:DUF397 domain-containing protein [Streptomyces sp. NPDC057565]|uniref:DUF397 domain-containing protein n=1 Tax=Streptomyces sp. NPDC057565 TaxID=3346169 RepID=UPI00367A71DA
MKSTELDWFKSSYSTNEGGECIEVAYEGGACVEVATCPHTVHVRDSKVIDGPTFAVTAAAWSAFVAGARTA